MKYYELFSKKKYWFIIYALPLIILNLSCSNMNNKNKSPESQNILEEIEIGSQKWMAENLNVDSFRNGVKIKEVNSIEEWNIAFEDKKPAWCYYEFNPNNGIKYGKIYNWFAIVDSNGLAPNGWRIPFDKDWRILFEYLGGEDSADIKLKSATGWNLIDGKGNGDNSSGFNATPGGLLQGDFREIGNGAFYWGIVEKDSPVREITDKVTTGLSNRTEGVECIFTTDDGGFYVRCLKNN
jgi:uncharacterized protein (TIGR02145 family)